jgi:hypothetical protein
MRSIFTICGFSIDLNKIGICSEDAMIRGGGLLELNEYTKTMLQKFYDLYQ